MSPPRSSRKPPASSREFATGSTGSGKSHLLRRWAKVYPRQLVLDVTGEWSSPRDFAGEIRWASNREELRQALQEVVRLPRWRVVVPPSRVDMEELTNLLVPEYRPGRTSFPRAVGGMALIIDEAAEVAGHGDAAKVKPLWLRGRHHGLSILAASQRAADVGRMVTSQSQRLAVLQTEEPIDLAYWRQSLRPEWYAAVLTLRQYEAVIVDRVKRRAAVYTTEGEIVRPIAAAGVGVAAQGAEE